MSPRGSAFCIARGARICMSGQSRLSNIGFRTCELTCRRFCFYLSYRILHISVAPHGIHMLLTFWSRSDETYPAVALAQAGVLRTLIQKLYCMAEKLASFVVNPFIWCYLPAAPLQVLHFRSLLKSDHQLLPLHGYRSVSFRSIPRPGIHPDI